MTDFKKEAIAGLRKFPKQISSKFFYDKKGDRIFQEITELSEYYLTKKELEILDDDQLSDYIQEKYEELDIYELGAGDGTKTLVFLEKLLNKRVIFDYYPIDISGNVLRELSDNLTKKIDKSSIHPIEGTYFDTLKNLTKRKKRSKLVLFLGSNIGNLLHENAIAFLKELQESIHVGDRVLIGFDLKKDPHKILRAYNDQSGKTSAFNKNLLNRMNRELGADFDLDKFIHYPVYNPESGTCTSYLVSQEEQVVKIEEEEIHFQKWETIHTEISQKYTHDVIRWLSKKSNFMIETCFTDSEDEFADYLFYKS